MMSSNSNINSNVNNSNGELIANPHARVEPTPENPYGYSSFDMRLVPSYMNNQLIYYFITDVISVIKQACF